MYNSGPSVPIYVIIFNFNCLRFIVLEVIDPSNIPYVVVNVKAAPQIVPK